MSLSYKAAKVSWTRLAKPDNLDPAYISNLLVIFPQNGLRLRRINGSPRSEMKQDRLASVKVVLEFRLTSFVAALHIPACSRQRVQNLITGDRCVSP